MKFKNILLLLFVMGFMISCTTPKSDDNSHQTQIEDSKPKNISDNTPTGQEKAVLKQRQIVDTVMQKRFDAAKSQEITAAQKATGMKICNCMNEIKIFSKVAKAKSQEEFDKLAGDDRYNEILEIQKCHYKVMKPAIQSMDKIDGGIYAYKSREYLETKCMNSNPDLWMYIGKYISEHAPKK